ncbi:TonB-dependent receptor [Pseudoxanthomonas sp. Root65]|uniref:TonB-dependent receptor plug domain-containing protein n=1 Tax=Pseudoxanthomonas sp. Root65 TaxID=1736576 RepID=UPI0006F45245|nr:TonB-dependent receptor [Pseudoxanthomonas sp. Root65]KRA53943.1 TonB-dependent receptor [Pseudoxanthomonas sp. Root65]
MKARRRTLASAIRLAVLLALPATVMAQEATTLDTLTVTGSRIKRAEMEGRVPVQTLSREEIERTGLTSIGDILQELTGSGSALNTKFNSSGNFGFSPNGDGVGAGSAQVDLRNLGPKRVLVLVDGMRWVNESSASGVSAAVDLNTIPLALVERIEVLEDGASSLYGSDAIAGVVNIITRRNFDGGQVTLNYGQFDKGDGEVTGADLAWGFDNERNNLFLSLSYTEQKEVSSADRDISSIPIQGGSSRILGGRFSFTDPNEVAYDLSVKPGQTNPVYTPGQPACGPGVVRSDGFQCFDFNRDAFNYAPFNLLMTPSKRMGAFAQYRFSITDELNFYAKALYNRRESTNQAAPEPIDLGPGAGTSYTADLVIPANHPFNPFGFDLIGSGPNANIGTIRRRPLEGGPRIFEQEVDTQYIAAGLEGSFGGERTFFWDVNAAFSKNEAEQTNRGSYNARNIAIALGDPAVCAATSGCTPLDIFGFDTITPAMLAYISPLFRDRSEQKLTQVTANLSGALFEAWAGDVEFAAGYEYRKYEGSYNPDPQTVAGEYNGVPSQPTSGEYDVNEVYLELNVPLYAQQDGPGKFDLSLAGRYSDYSTFGGEFTPKYGLRWQVAEELLLRATYAEGFRAPSIGELYGSQSRFDAQLVDPCLVPPGAPAGSLAPIACPGVPVGARQNDPQIPVLTGGNPALQPETARSFSAGLVFSPSFAEDVAWSDKLDFELTFYRHDLEGPIQAINAQAQLDLCATTQDPQYCAGINRLASGEIDTFANFLINLGSIKTDGWDADVFWTLPESRLGRFKLSWQNTFVTRYEARGAGGELQPQGPGLVVTDTAIPEWTSNATLDWKLGNWNAAWSIRHLSEMEEDCLAIDPAAYCSTATTNTLAATTYHDLQLGYEFEWFKGLQLTGGVNNVFDEDPPVCTSCSLNGYEASTYDIPGGRFFYVRANLRF